MVLNIAHRGGAGLAPENTISCFKKGLKYSNMLEFDVQPSKDKYVLIFHDRFGVERTTNGKGKLTDLTFNYLRSLDAGSWYHARYVNEKIPTLGEVLELSTHKEVQFNIELKYYDPNSDWFENTLIKTIKKYKIENRTVFTARHVENITRIQTIDSRIDCALLQKEREKEKYLNLLLALDLKTAQIRLNTLEESFIKACHDNDIRVFFFYADDRKTMNKAVNLEIDGILTNYPNKLNKFLTKEL